MSNELMMPNDWQMMKQQADMLIKSGFLPNAIKTPEQALAIMLKGRELNVPPMEALSGINVIQGKPTVSPQLMLAMARRTGQLEDMHIEQTADKCTVMIMRKGQSPHTEVFSMADAKAQGLATKDNWRKMPGIMMKWRALAANLRVTFPDVTCGTYTHEEMGLDVDEEGNSKEVVIQVKDIEPTPPVSIQAPPTAAPEPSLSKVASPPPQAPPVATPDLQTAPWEGLDDEADTATAPPPPPPPPAPPRDHHPDPAPATQASTATATAPPAAAKDDPYPDSRKITEPQRKRLFAIWKKANWDEVSVKSFMQTTYQIISTTLIPMDYYDDICTYIEEHPKS